MFSDFKGCVLSPENTVQERKMLIAKSEIGSALILLRDRDGGWGYPSGKKTTRKI